MGRREASWRRGPVGRPEGRGAVEKGQRGRLRGSLQEGDGAIAGDLAERTTGRAVLGLAGRLPLAERAVRGDLEAVLERGLLRTVAGGVGDGRGRRQEDFQPQRHREQHSRDRVASHPARFRPT